MFVVAGSFGRRASDGGANLHIYYPANSNNSGGAGGQPMENMYTSPTSRECLRITGEPTTMIGGGVDANTVAMEGNDESNDEIQR